MAQGSQVKNWQASLFGCFDNAVMCLFAWCVPCGGVCMQALDAKLSNTKDTNAAVMACVCAWCLSCIGAGYNRSKLREIYGISGNFFIDCILHWFCGCCAVTQEWQEVMFRVHNDKKISICNIPKK
mmetsp:Transcript_4493/g.8663  ORF Transcript_4493/g.8663 Transcript_4493/m.8663 type:complete len:126 (-) Transcript_4493:177-554(-)